MLTYEEHIKIIEEYREEKGKLPIIKGQRSAQRYLDKLHQKQDKASVRIREIELMRFKARAERYLALDSLVDKILDLLDGPKIFSQFLGTMVLSAPLPSESVRCIRNEKNKPIYITALTVALFEEVRVSQTFTNHYIRQTLTEVVSDSSSSLMSRENRKVFSKTDKMAYREELLKPIVKATLLRQIGSYSQEANEIYQGNRFKLLGTQERSKLLQVIKKNSYLYLNQGIGIANKKFDNKEEKESFEQKENAKLAFMNQLIDSDNQDSDLRDLARIPMVYASFMLSTKEEFAYQGIYQAYDILKEGINQGVYSTKFCVPFLKMVGRFPLGSGVYFISKETGTVEKGIVSSLFPVNPEEPYIKQVTRYQIQSLNQSEIVVNKSTNIYFARSRENSGFGENFFKQRYQAPYVWNANEVWEVQVPALVFWKKDGTIKQSNATLLEN